MIAPVSPSFLADFAQPESQITLARATRTPDRKPDRYLDGYGFWMGADISDESRVLMERGNSFGLFATVEALINRQEFLYEQRRQRDQRRLEKSTSVERISTLRKSVERYTDLAARARMGVLMIGIRRLSMAAGKGRSTIRRRLAHLERCGFISTRTPGMQSVFVEKVGRIVRTSKGRVKPMEIQLTLVPAQMRPKQGSQAMVSPRDHQNTSLRSHHETTTLDLPKTKKPRAPARAGAGARASSEKEEIREKKDRDNAATPTSGLSPALGDALRLKTDPVDREVENLDAEGDALRELASHRRQEMELGGDPESDRAKGVTYRDQWRRDQAAYDRSRLAAEDQNTEGRALDSLSEMRAGRSPLPPLEPDLKQVATLAMLKAQALRELGQVAKKVRPKRLKMVKKLLAVGPAGR